MVGHVPWKNSISLDAALVQPGRRACAQSLVGRAWIVALFASSAGGKKSYAKLAFRSVREYFLHLWRCTGVAFQECHKKEMHSQGASGKTYRTRCQYQEGYGWEAAALCDSSQLIGRVLVPGLPTAFLWCLGFHPEGFF